MFLAKKPISMKRGIPSSSSEDLDSEGSDVTTPPSEMGNIEISQDAEGLANFDGGVDGCHDAALDEMEQDPFRLLPV